MGALYLFDIRDKSAMRGEGLPPYKKTRSAGSGAGVETAV